VQLTKVFLADRREPMDFSFCNASHDTCQHQLRRLQHKMWSRTSPDGLGPLSVVVTATLGASSVSATVTFTWTLVRGYRVLREASR
jgi:hypothetical protein